MFHVLQLELFKLSHRFLTYQTQPGSVWECLTLVWNVCGLMTTPGQPSFNFPSSILCMRIEFLGVWRASDIKPHCWLAVVVRSRTSRLLPTHLMTSLAATLSQGGALSAANVYTCNILLLWPAFSFVQTVYVGFVLQESKSNLLWKSLSHWGLKWMRYLCSAHEH